MNKEKGFTLLEVLIVLSIWSIIILLATPIIFGRIDEKQDEVFFEVLEFDLLYMQRVASMTKEYVRFRMRGNQYVILKGREETVLLRRDLPPGVIIDMKSLSAISFDQNGRIRQPFTVMIKTDQSNYSLVFPLGKGRSYVVKK